MKFWIKTKKLYLKDSINIKKQSQDQTHCNWLSSKKNSWGKTIHDSCWGQYEWFQVSQVSIRKPNAMIETLFKSNALFLENIEEIHITKS